MTVDGPSSYSQSTEKQEMCSREIWIPTPLKELYSTVKSSIFFTRWFCSAGILSTCSEYIIVFLAWCDFGSWFLDNLEWSQRVDLTLFPGIYELPKGRSHGKCADEPSISVAEYALAFCGASLGKTTWLELPCWTAIDLGFWVMVLNDNFKSINKLHC